MNSADMVAVDIINAIRSAVAHERAAAGHEDKYEQQMKSAGANMFHAFTLALRSAGEYLGRKMDDKAVLRVYNGTKPRKWWDEQLAAAKGGDREHASRLIQWHLDVEGARARRAKHAIACETLRKQVAKQRTSAAHGSREHHKPEPEPTRVEMRALVEEGTANAATVTLEDLLGEVSRLQVAAKKVEPANRGEAMAAVRNAAREIERYVP